MANIQIDTIGVSGNYPDLITWWNAEGLKSGSATANLVQADLCKIAHLLPFQTHPLSIPSQTYGGLQMLPNAGPFNFINPSMLGWTDANHFFVVRAAPGYEFNGDFSNSGTPVVLDNGTSGPLITCKTPFTRFENFILQATPFANSQMYRSVSLGEVDTIVDVFWNLQNYAHTALVLQDSCVADSVGITQIMSYGYADSVSRSKAVGIDARNSSTVRNCVVDEIKTHSIAIGTPCVQAYTLSAGIVFDTTCDIKNNTVGNVTSINEGGTSDIYDGTSSQATSMGFYCQTPGIQAPIVQEVFGGDNTAEPECNSGSSLCAAGSTMDVNGLPYSDGESYNASCQVRATIAGLSPGADGCAGVNGVYILTWNPAISKFTLPYDEFICGGEGVPDGLIWTDLTWFQMTDASNLILVNCSLDYTEGMDCRNLSLNGTDSGQTLGCCVGTANGATVSIESVPPLENRSVIGYEVTNSGVALYQQFENNVSFNIYASGQGAAPVGFGPI